MPILTPAYPSMNSTANVSRNTLDVMVYEMNVAHEKVRQCLGAGGEGWASVFEPTDFAVSHEKYLVCDTYVRNLPEHEAPRLLQSWTGYVDSRLRSFVEKLEYGLPLVNLRLLPKKLPLLAAKAQADAQGGEGQAYLVGFGVDRSRLQGTEIHVTNKVEEFKEEMYNGAIRNGLLNETVTRDQLRLRVSQFQSWSELPDVAFELLGGRDAAALARKRVRKAKREARAREKAEAAAAMGPSYLGSEYNDDDPAFADAGADADATDDWSGAAAVGAKRSADDVGAAPAAKAAKLEANEGLAMQQQSLQRVESSSIDLFDAHAGGGNQAPAGGGASKIKLTLS